VPDSVKEGAEVGRLAADGIAMVLGDGFSVAFECSWGENA
jgi:hypothetical protein